MADVRASINTNVVSELEAILSQRFEIVGHYIENTAKVNCPVDTVILRHSLPHDAY